MRPTIERIGPLAGFGLDKLPDDRDPLGFAIADTAAAGARRCSDEYLHRAVERHQAGFHTELPVADRIVIERLQQKRS